MHCYAPVNNITRGAKMTRTSTKRAEPQDPGTFIPPELAAIGTQGAEEFKSLENQFINGCQKQTDLCFERGRNEIARANQLLTGLLRAHSVLDASKAWSEWGYGCIHLVFEDVRRAQADMQQITEAGARLLTPWAALYHRPLPTT